MYFYRLKNEVINLLDRGGYLNSIGKENIFPVKFRTVSAIYPKLDTAICRDCKLRIFRECQTSLPDGTLRSPLTT